MLWVLAFVIGGFTALALKVVWDHRAWSRAALQDLEALLPGVRIDLVSTRRRRRVRLWRGDRVMEVPLASLLHVWIRQANNLQARHRGVIDLLLEGIFSSMSDSDLTELLREHDAMRRYPLQIPDQDDPSAEVTFDEMLLVSLWGLDSAARSELVEAVIMAEQRPLH